MKNIKLILTSMILIQNLVYSQVANQPSDLFTCDNANNGGFAEFDLTVNDQQIIGAQDPTSFVINYYWTQADALSDINQILIPTSFANDINPQQIYARIEEISNNENFDTTSFNIQVLPLPVISNITPLEACDDSFAPSGDGIAEFDLTSKNVEILNGQDAASFEINYFQSFQDAENNVNGFSFYVNTSNPQTIWVRLENIETSCFSIGDLEIVTIDCTDNDDDGVIDSDEDLNSNGNLDDDDTDQDSIANYMDSDDDGDNVNTLNEINITSGSNSNLSYTFIDTDGDIIPNHIDNDDDNDGVLTIDEDYNNNGDPTDDDTDNSGIADYLEANVALSIESFENQNLKMFPNPSNDLVTIKASNQISNISIYNVQGKQVNLEIIKNSVSELNFSVINLENGIYFIKIQNEFKETIMKLIVK